VQIILPEVPAIISAILNVEASFDGETYTIEEAVGKHRRILQENQLLVRSPSEENDIKILVSILTDVLIRAMRGESGAAVNRELHKTIHSKKDLTTSNYQRLLRQAKYRWGVKTGTQVMNDVVEIFETEYHWDWGRYFNEAEKNAGDDFPQDKLLGIKNISFKVRDLALSSFSPSYVANDLHVVRVITRIGLLNYGFDLLGDSNLEMGNI